MALGTAVRFRWATLIVTSVIFLGIAGTITRLGEQLMPKFRETDFLMHWVEKPGIGIDAMDRITLRASEEMMAVDGVLNLAHTSVARRSPTKWLVPTSRNFG